MLDCTTNTTSDELATTPCWSGETPTLISIGIQDTQWLLSVLQERCGASFDELAIYQTLTELLSRKTAAYDRVRAYVDGQTQMRCGFGLCYETKQFLQCFESMAHLLMYKFLREGLYVQDTLAYRLDHMRTNRLILRHSASFKQRLSNEFANIT